jgi:hypothetical protein
MVLNKNAYHVRNKRYGVREYEYDYEFVYVCIALHACVSVFACGCAYMCVCVCVCIRMCESPVSRQSTHYTVGASRNIHVSTSLTGNWGAMKPRRC